jgi:hypothetical protein
MNCQQLNFCNIYVMEGRVKGGGRASPTLTSWANYSIMMKCTPESGNCRSVCTLWSVPMRPKARGPTQQGDPPLEESDPAECDFVPDGRSMTSALTDHTTCPYLGLICYKMYKIHRHEQCHARKVCMAYYSTVVDPCFSGPYHPSTICCFRG